MCDMNMAGRQQTGMRRWSEGFMVTHITTVVTRQTSPPAGAEMLVKEPRKGRGSQRENKYLRGHLRNRGRRTVWTTGEPRTPKSRTPAPGVTAEI